MGSRRSFLALSGLAAAALTLPRAGPALWDRFGPLPDLTGEDVPEGYLRLASGGDVTAGISDPFIGLEAEGAIRATPLSPDTLCDLLYSGLQEGHVALNYFSDYNCPYCRELGATLAQLAAEDLRISLRYHELPLLGPSSVLGAQAALAAAKQGKYLQMHQRLNTGIVRITEAYIAQIAQELGLDLEAFADDLDAPETQAILSRNKGVAEAFRVIGTPFLMVGRIAVYGQISPALLRRLITADAAQTSCVPNV